MNLSKNLLMLADLMEENKLVSRNISDKMIKFLVKSQKYEKFVKSQNYKANFLNSDANSIFFNLKLIQNS